MHNIDIKLHKSGIIECDLGARKNRGRFDIIKCILFVLSGNKAKKTHILNKCNLNTHTLEKYLKMLEDGGSIRIEKSGRETSYNLTDKGILALLAMKALYKLLFSPDTSINCKNNVRELLDSKNINYLENAYLSNKSNVQLPVSFYITGDSKAIIIVEASDSELALIYSSLILALLSEESEISETIIISQLDEGTLGNVSIVGAEGSLKRMKFIGGCSKPILEKTFSEFIE